MDQQPPKRGRVSGVGRCINGVEIHWCRQDTPYNVAFELSELYFCGQNIKFTLQTFADVDGGDERKYPACMDTGARIPIGISGIFGLDVLTNLFWKLNIIEYTLSNISIAVMKVPPHKDYPETVFLYHQESE